MKIKTSCCNREYEHYHGYSPIRQNPETGQVVCYWCGCVYHHIPDSVALNVMHSMVRFLKEKRLTKEKVSDTIEPA